MVSITYRSVFDGSYHISYREASCSHGYSTILGFPCTPNTEEEMTFDLCLPMNTILFTRASLPQSVEYSLSKSSYTPWTIILLVSLVTDTTPYVCVCVRACVCV